MKQRQVKVSFRHPSRDAGDRAVRKRLRNGTLTLQIATFCRAIRTGDPVTIGLEVVRSEDLSPERLAEIRALLVDAFDDGFSDDDWDHTLGGWHLLAMDKGLLAHAAVVERVLDVGGRALRAGYVEGVATTPTRQGEGLGSLVMRRVGQLLVDEFEVGALSTGRHAFYERLGWERWRGPTFVRDVPKLVRTADEDDGIMVLRYGTTKGLDLRLPISCETRPGDDW